ncbi:hypothetical protein ABW19_dt0205172 [Dactylella cylindrospora]|nr:hypothetical protein ABW19_dt0205172 [Dactylella cylindrospora]
MDNNVCNIHKIEETCNWSDYPLESHDTSRNFDDLRMHHRWLNDDAERLFNSTKSRFEVLLPSLISQSLVSSEHYKVDRMWRMEVVEAITELDRLIEKYSEHDSEDDMIFFLSQDSTWGRFQITLELFKRLCHSLSIPPRFDYRLSGGPKMKGTMSGFELMYNLRYFELHGRREARPWSLRQTAIYHRYDSKSMRSIILTLQCSPSIRSRIEDLFVPKSGIQTLSKEDVMLLHVCVLMAMESTWRAYINYLESELRTLDDKALGSEAEADRAAGCSVGFVDSQDLQFLRQQLLKASEILDSTARIAKDLGKFSKLIFEDPTDETACIFSQTLDQYQSRLQNYQRGIATLLDVFSGVGQIISQALQYRNDKAIIRTNSAMHENGESLKEITIAAKEESEALAALTSKTYKDSRMVKILTIVAVIYVPASLVAEIFSSSLINVSGAPASSQVAVIDKFWVYPLTVATLAVITLIAVVLVHFLYVFLKRGAFWRRRAPSSDSVC